MSSLSCKKAVSIRGIAAAFAPTGFEAFLAARITPISRMAARINPARTRRTIGEEDLWMPAAGVGGRELHHTVGTWWLHGAA